MPENNYDKPVDQMQTEVLDYWMYRHAAKVLDQAASASIAQFEKGYKNGQYQFSSDKALLADLMVQYHIRLQMLGDEWLASTESQSRYGAHPIEAACRLVVAQSFGERPSC